MTLASFSSISGKSPKLRPVGLAPPFWATYQWRLGGSRGAHGPGYMGLLAIAGAPVGAKMPVMPPNGIPNPSQRHCKKFKKSQISKFSAPTMTQKHVRLQPPQLKPKPLRREGS